MWGPGWHCNAITGTPLALWSRRLIQQNKTCMTCVCLLLQKQLNHCATTMWFATSPAFCRCICISFVGVSPEANWLGRLLSKITGDAGLKHAPKWPKWPNPRMIPSEKLKKLCIMSPRSANMHMFVDLLWYALRNLCWWCLCRKWNGKAWSLWQVYVLHWRELEPLESTPKTSKETWSGHWRKRTPHVPCLDILWSVRRTELSKHVSTGTPVTKIKNTMWFLRCRCKESWFHSMSSTWMGRTPLKRGVHVFVYMSSSSQLIAHAANVCAYMHSFLQEHACASTQWTVSMDDGMWNLAGRCSLSRTNPEILATPEGCWVTSCKHEPWRRPHTNIFMGRWCTIHWVGPKCLSVGMWPRHGRQPDKHLPIIPLPGRFLVAIMLLQFVVHAQ